MYYYHCGNFKEKWHIFNKPNSTPNLAGLVVYALVTGEPVIRIVFTATDLPEKYPDRLLYRHISWPIENTHLLV
jgi:hypothetical protein